MFNCNLETNNQLLIIFGTNIPDTTCHQVIILFPTLPNVCFCTTWGNTTSKISLFYPRGCQRGVPFLKVIIYLLLACLT